MDPTSDKISTGRVTAAGIEADTRRARIEQAMSMLAYTDAWATSSIAPPIPPVYQPVPTIKHLGRPKAKS